MAIFLTGATGYIGSYIASGLLEGHEDRLALLVRAKSVEEGEKRLWKSLQMHMEFERFQSFMAERVDIVLGDLTGARLGLEEDAWRDLGHQTDSIIHCAASLNRKSAKSCFNVNLRGTMQMLKLARNAQDHHGLRRFSDISTVAAAGHRQNEIVAEAGLIDWARSDYDPYARTKKFCEYMIHELLPDVTTTVFRPSIVLGDSRFPQTTQFDMVRAFVYLAKMPFLPFQAGWRADIVPANFVAKAVVTIHQKDAPKYDSYNLSSGALSPSYRDVVDAMRESGHRRSVFIPWLNKPFSALINTIAATPRGWGIALPAALMKVFMPYLTNNTVFDNSRVCEELGEQPKPFPEYAFELYRFATKGRFSYDYKPWPEGAKPCKVSV